MLRGFQRLRYSVAPGIKTALLYLGLRELGFEAYYANWKAEDTENRDCITKFLLGVVPQKRPPSEVLQCAEHVRLWPEDAWLQYTPSSASLSVVACGCFLLNPMGPERSLVSPRVWGALFDINPRASPGIGGADHIGT